MGCRRLIASILCSHGCGGCCAGCFSTTWTETEVLRLWLSWMTPFHSNPICCGSPNVTGHLAECEHQPKQAHCNCPTTGHLAGCRLLPRQACTCPMTGHRAGCGLRHCNCPDTGHLASCGLFRRPHCNCPSTRHLADCHLLPRQDCNCPVTGHLAGCHLLPRQDCNCPLNVHTALCAAQQSFRVRAQARLHNEKQHPAAVQHASDAFHHQLAGPTGSPTATAKHHFWECIAPAPVDVEPHFVDEQDCNNLVRKFQQAVQRAIVVPGKNGTIVSCPDHLSVNAGDYGKTVLNFI